MCKFWFQLTRKGVTLCLISGKMVTLTFDLFMVHRVFCDVSNLRTKSDEVLPYSGS